MSNSPCQKVWQVQEEGLLLERMPITADWYVNGTGQQRHKNWCGIHKYGEEDIDEWEVVPAGRPKS